MSEPVVVWLVVGLVTSAATAALLVGLVRHVLVLGRSLGRFQREVGTLAAEVADEAARATDRSARLSGGAMRDMAGR